MKFNETLMNKGFEFNHKNVSTK